jgi:hypothetical protein
MQRLFAILCVSILIRFPAKAQDPVTAANQFISMLDSSQKAETIFPFDGAEKYNYHFVPLERKGITFNEMNEAQQKAAYKLLQTCLSAEGVKKTKSIMQLDAVLKVLENRKPDDHFRDPGNYHISIFGIPAKNTIWGWRFEGHHISFNFSVDQQKLVAGTPGFLGSNPAIVLSGPKKGEQVLKEETDKGFSLLHSLTPQQLKIAVFDTAAPAEIFTLDKRQAMIEHPLGIAYTELTADQQQKLLALVNVYVHRYTKLFAEDMIKEIMAAGLGNIRFCWAGNLEPVLGKPTYYRVQGPTFIIEYDNTQNNANHVHSVLRDLKHDFGGDELLEHYQQSHAK